MKKENCVAVVFDEEFGTRLSDLAVVDHVWIADSECNRTVVDELTKRASEIRGFTMFQSAIPFTELLEMVFEHHGPYACDPPVSVVRLVGMESSPQLLDALKQHSMLFVSVEGNDLCCRFEL